MNKSILSIPLILLILTGCIETQSSKGYRSEESKRYSVPEQEVAIDSNTVFSVFQSPLPPKELKGREKDIRDAELKRTRILYSQAPDALDNIMAYARELALSGLYYESIKMYSVGLEKHPTSYKLLRHRGQRYITIRQFDLAVEDLQKAAFYSRPAINQTEKADPASSGPTLSNEKFNIYYNLGIAYYLKGNYDKAISSFKKCLTYSNNNDLLVRATDWFYLTYRKIGNETAAKDLLLSIDKKMKVKEYVDYLNRLLVYKGIFNAENVLAYAENEGNSLTPILAYGIGCWYLFEGDVQKATQVYERILLNKAWDSFEYIAAEVDLKNMQGL